MAAGGLHISISAEPVVQIGSLVISNSMLTSLVVSVVLITFAVAVRTQIKESGKPTGLQNLAEMIVEGLNNLVQGVTGSQKKTRHFFPLIASFFLVILLNNWLGLFPGVGTIGYIHKEDESKEHAMLAPSSATLDPVQVQASTEISQTETHEDVEVDTTLQQEAAEGEATGTVEYIEEGSHETFVPYLRAGTADLNTTLALAIVSVFMTQVFGYSYLKLGYFSKFFNFSSPIAFMIGLLEAVLEMAKVVSFAFRLFGNIFAGEVLLAVISFLVPVIVPMPFYGLEVAVGAIQALVFAMLSVVFFNMATLGHEEH